MVPPFGKRRFICLGLIALFAASCFGNGSITLAWDPNLEPDVAGYVVYFGAASGKYTNRVDVGNVTTYTVTGLAEGTDYFFAVTAYNSSRLESDYSNEISYRLPGSGLNQAPVIASAGPFTIDEGTLFRYTFTVTNLDQGTRFFRWLLGSGAPDGAAIDPGSGEFTWTPMLSQGGSQTTIQIVATDQGTPALVGDRLVTVIVHASPANVPPSISEIPDQAIDEDSSTAAISFEVGDPETPAGNLLVSGSSSNPTLVPNQGIIFGGSGSNRTVRVLTAAHQFGATTIKLTVTDTSGSEVSASFVLTVNAVDDAPAPFDIPDQTTSEDVPAGPIAFTVGRCGNCCREFGLERCLFESKACDRCRDYFQREREQSDGAAPAGQQPIWRFYHYGHGQRHKRKRVQ